MRVELLGGGVSTDFGHSRGPSLNLRNQHVAGKASPAPWPFARRSRGSPHGSAMYPDHSFNASAVLTDAPLHDRTQGGAQSPSRLHAYRSPPCLTLRLLTAKHTRRRVDIPPTPALQLLPTFLQYCSRTSARILARRPRPYGPRQRRGHREGTTLVEVSSWRRDGRPVQLSHRLFEQNATFFAGPGAWPTGNGICHTPGRYEKTSR